MNETTTPRPLRTATIALVGALACGLIPGAALAQTAMTRAEVKALLKPCVPDYQNYCSDVPRGGGRIFACLVDHEKQLSPACAANLPKMQAAAAQARKTVQ